MLRKLLLQILSGNKPIVFDNAGAKTDAGKHFAQMAIELLEGKRALHVTNDGPRNEIDPARATGRLLDRSN